MVFVFARSIGLGPGLLGGGTGGGNLSGSFAAVNGGLGSQIMQRPVQNGDFTLFNNRRRFAFQHPIYLLQYLFTQ